MKLLVTGVQSQLAQSLKEAAKSHGELEVEFVGRPELELEQPGRAAAIIAERAPDIIINAAAYTAVDQAESEPDRALRVNAAAVGEIAEAARNAGARLVHISTDYVFDGESSAAYSEDAATAPLNVYGASKLAGEELVRAACPEHLIVRTSWVYSPFGSNFVRTMLRLAGDRDEVRVVADQVGCLTSALDLAEAPLGAITRWDGQGQTYHLAGPDACTWLDFASAIFASSPSLGGPSARVVPISTAEYRTPARRPRHSVLDSGKFARDFAITLPDLRTSVDRVVKRLVA